MNGPVKASSSEECRIKGKVSSFEAARRGEAAIFRSRKAKSGEVNGNGGGLIKKKSSRGNKGNVSGEEEKETGRV